MKKFQLVIMSMLFALLFGFTSCNSCGNKQTQEVAAVDTSEVVAVGELNVEHVIAMDRQYMYTNYAKDYRWFETCITLKDFLDEENDGTVTSVSNVFQVVEEKGNGADVYVILAAHTPDTTAYDVKHGFWVEDQVLNEEAVTISFKQAYERLMEANCPKPHSKQVVLRKEVGPVDANPQYIFGNSKAQVYVDAKTGNVSLDNPVFPEAKGFKMPLGEWP